MQDSIWFRTLDEGEREPFERCDELPRTAEIVIVGAGMVGLAAAYYLVRCGLRDICVVERGSVLGEASGANAGGLWFAHESVELGAIAALNRESSRLYGELAGEYSFGLERSGMLELLDSDEEVEEAAARAERLRTAGFRVESMDARTVSSVEPSLGIKTSGALYYPDEGHLHPAKLASVLLRSLHESGVRICTSVEVDDVRRELVTSRGSIDAKTVIIAAGAWTPLLTRVLGWEPPIRPVRGTLLAVGPAKKTLHHTISAKSFYYWQLASGHVAGGGTLDDVGFRRGVDPDTTAKIREEMNQLLPALSELPTECAWSGFRPYCEDMKPVIGAVPGRANMYVAAGHFRKGIMQSTGTGKMLADMITRGTTDLPAEAFRPDRFACSPAANSPQ